MKDGPYHAPVLLQEVIKYLAPEPGDVIVDCNLGDGGHSMEILKRMRGEGLLVGIDIDPQCLGRASRRIESARYAPYLYRLIVGNHADLAHLLAPAQIPPAGGILLDLGLSTPQFFNPRLGMSWDSDEALDMRLNPDSGRQSAAEIVNEWEEKELARIFREYAQEKWSRQIARRIVRERERRKIRTGRELGELVGSAVPRKAWPPKIHVATRVFLALRIEANGEIENLERVLPQAYEALKPGGRLVVISFHSGEDRIVKRFFRQMSKKEGEAPWPLPQKGAEGKARMVDLTRKPVTPGEEEIAANPASRSARLRAARKVF